MVTYVWKHVYYAWEFANLELSFLQIVGIFVYLTLVVITGVREQLDAIFHTVPSSGWKSETLANVKI